MGPSSGIRHLPLLFILLLSAIQLIAATHNTTTTTTDSTDTAIDTTDRYSPLDFLHPHNYARRLVGCDKLSWNVTLEVYARSYLRRCRKRCRLVPYRKPYGLNIFFGRHRRYKRTVAVAIRSWVRERRWYHYKKNRCAKRHVCSHYTQVVWRRTKFIGCAVDWCRKRRRPIVVCVYWPRGNIPGKRPYLTDGVNEEEENGNPNYYLEGDDHLDEEMENEAEEEEERLPEVSDGLQAEEEELPQVTEVLQEEEEEDELPQVTEDEEMKMDEGSPIMMVTDAEE